MNLLAMADELNRKYFLGILNIDGVTITNKKASCYPNRNDLTAYYLGDRLGGKIFFIAERLHSLDSSTIRRIIFCEMAQQLDLNSDHAPHFQMLMKRYEGGATEQESLEFSWALKRNIELKAKNGRLNNSAMLPAVAKVAIRKIKLAKTKEDIKDIFKILAGFAAFIGLASGLGLIAIGLIFGLATTSELPWIIPVAAISALYFTLEE